MAKGRLTAEEKLQPPLPGAEGMRKIPAVHKAGLAMLDACAETKAQKAREDAAREEVRAQMEKAGITDYEYAGLEIHIDLKRTPKVKLAKRTPDEDETEE